MEQTAIWAACCQTYSPSLSWWLWYCTSDSFCPQNWWGQHHSESRGLTERKNTTAVWCICVWQLFTIYSYCACTYEVQSTQALSTSILFFPQSSSQQRYTCFTPGQNQRHGGTNFLSTLCSESVLNEQRLLIPGPHPGHARRNESLPMPGLVHALKMMGSNTTISSAVSALLGFETAHWNVKVLRLGEDTCRDVRKVMQASARCCSCCSSNLSQLKCTYQPAHILSLSTPLRQRRVIN